MAYGKQKPPQECFKCKSAGFPNVPINFEKIGENPSTGKGIWKLIDPDTQQEHHHKGEITSKGTANPPTGFNQQKTDDIKAAQKERRQQHQEFIIAIKNLTKAMVYIQADKEGANAKDIISAMGFEEYREDQLNDSDPRV